MCVRSPVVDVMHSAYIRSDSLWMPVVSRSVSRRMYSQNENAKMALTKEIRRRPLFLVVSTVATDWHRHFIWITHAREQIMLRSPFGLCARLFLAQNKNLGCGGPRQFRKNVEWVRTVNRRHICFHCRPLLLLPMMIIPDSGLQNESKSLNDSIGCVLLNKINVSDSDAIRTRLMLLWLVFRLRTCLALIEN